ncbi:SusC/RagA family protein [Sphingobacterium sp. Ka21]|uniref:SusC/RagA family protein n=2 Tax=Sphingobacterium pedocola TaxID=2082722 RepID=A0ABR9T777_9SPHI|nr:SusC/RagA family protein [Sphingobacterium pedocola]
MGFKASEKGGSIVIAKNTTQQTQQKKIVGTIIDQQGQRMMGVNIVVKGATMSTVSDDNGNFIIDAHENDVLVISLVGYQTIELPVGKRTNLDVVLPEQQDQIDEVVVVGYGTQRRASVIGAISTIDPQVLQSNQTRSISNSLAGQVSGVIAVQRSGEPGYDNSDFWIRGINTFGANATPLVLVDGVERSLNNISPEEIESFSILKDATATAVYGVRGGNGVILIQTKRGKQGQPRLTVKADYGLSTPTQLPQFVDATKYMETVNIANELSGMGPLYTTEAIERTRIGYDPDLYPNVNWIEAVTTPFSSNGRISLDVNGGTERLKYSLVAAYFDEDGMIVTDKNQNYDSRLSLQKYNLRSNVDLNLTKSTTIAVGIGGFITERQAPGIGISTILNRAMDTPPNYHPIVYSNGEIPKVAARHNPWANATQTGFQRQFDSNLETSLNVIQDFGLLVPVLDGLKGSVLASFDSFNTHAQNRTKTPRTFFANSRNAEGELVTSLVDQGQEFLNYSRESSGNRTIYLESRLNYNKTFNSVHHLDGLFLFNLRDYVDQKSPNSIGALPYRNTGVAARSAYSFADRYFAEFNFGYNGSENFQKGYQFGFFPSVAIGWMPSNEPFFDGIRETISKLKIRGSWGLVGNDQLTRRDASDIRRFAYLATIDPAGGYGFGYTHNFNFGTSWREGDFGVNDLTWETAEKMNLGMELGLWNNAIHIQADFFKENRRDIFMQRKTIPETAGFNKAPWANFGRVTNRGMEVEMLVNHRFSEDLFIAARGNFTYARNIVTEFDEPENLKNSTRARTGQPIHQHFGLIATGLYSYADFEDESKGILRDRLATPMFGPIRAGDVRYQDVNGDGVVDSYDIAPIGKPHVPQVIFGFGLNTRYKNVDVGLLFQGATDFTNMMQGPTLVPGSGGGGTGNIYANVDDRWTPENPSSNVIWPRLSNIESANNMLYSSWWLVNASYLRLKNMEIGYTLSKRTQERILMKNARVFVRGSNLLTFSHFKMWDPEIGSQNGLKYPLQRIVSGGIEITF